VSPLSEQGPGANRTPEKSSRRQAGDRGKASTASRWAVQIRLELTSHEEPSTCAEVIPGHRLTAAELDMRFALHTLPRQRGHWWLYTEAGRYQRELLERLGWWAA
jgi:hypothetical protein